MHVVTAHQQLALVARSFGNTALLVLDTSTRDVHLTFALVY
jgi:hypothetical protein